MKRLLATALSLSAFSLSVVPASVSVAQGHASSSSADSIIETMTSQFTPNTDGVPTGTAGGGSRGTGSCPTESVNYGSSLVPIVAATEQNLTVEEHPFLLVHMTNKAVSQLFLSVVDEQGDYDFQTYISIPQESGVLKIALPENAPALAPGSTYTWSLAIICGNSLRPDDPVVQGTIQRVSLTPMYTVDMVEQLRWYTENGVWYDTIATLAEAYQADPADNQLSAIWNSSLDAIGLQDLVSAPLLF